MVQLGVCPFFFFLNKDIIKIPPCYFVFIITSENGTFYLVRKCRIIYLPFLLIQTLRLILVFHFMTQVAMSVIEHLAFPVPGLFTGIGI